MIDHGVVILCAEKTGRKDHRMERNVVLGHELKQFHLEASRRMRVFAGEMSLVVYLLRGLPPLFPIAGVVGSDRQVADRSVEPNVEDLNDHIQ